MDRLQIKNISKSFKKKKVVDSISFEISSGEIVSLLGPNGAGKTTSFYMVVGLVKPDAGNINFNNENISILPIHERAKLGISYLPQESSIFRKLTVSENILAILELQPISRKKRFDRLNQLLDEFNITHIKDQQGISLSGGERRRVEIARALAVNPKFILLDEPFAGVDPISIIDTKSIIKKLKDRNIGVLITDHNVRDTLDICDRAYIVNKGQILASGSPAEITKNPQVKIAYLGKDFSHN